MGSLELPEPPGLLAREFRQELLADQWPLVKIDHKVDLLDYFRFPDSFSDCGSAWPLPGMQPTHRVWLLPMSRVPAVPLQPVVCEREA